MRRKMTRELRHAATVKRARAKAKYSTKSRKDGEATHVDGTHPRYQLKHRSTPDVAAKDMGYDGATVDAQPVARDALQVLPVDLLKLPPTDVAPNADPLEQKDDDVAAEVPSVPQDPVILVDSNSCEGLLHNITVPGYKYHMVKCTTALPTPRDDPPTLNINKDLRIIGYDNNLGKKRFVFRVWPRDPYGPELLDINFPQGKRAGNELPIWGATLHDFYHFDMHRNPTAQHRIAIASGSQLVAAMRNIGELEWTTTEIVCADKEGEPKQIHPYGMHELLEAEEDYNQPVCPAILYEDEVPLASVEDGDGTTAEMKKTRRRSESTTAVERVFDPLVLPPPWRSIPFRTPIHKLEQRIPTHILPQRLIVHDSWGLLSAKIRDMDPRAGLEQETDTLWTYELQLSSEALDSAPHVQPPTQEYHAYTIEQWGAPPVVAFVRPVLPLESIPEAHLYISPVHQAGVGNHSVVYKAEWELPRSLFLSQPVCRECLTNTIAEHMQGRHSRREYPYDELPTDTTASLSVDSAPSQPEYRIGEIPKSTVALESTCTPTEGFPADSIPSAERAGGSRVKVDEERKSEDPEGYESKRTPPRWKARFVTSSSKYEIEGSKVNEFPHHVKVFPEGTWQNPKRDPSCCHSHHSKRAASPTFRVRVIAKLSIEHDKHFTREAKAYQSFPSHLSEYWSGYNIVPPLRDPVPVNAVVPQFYGYYVPEKSMTSKARYLSPILLLEDCGVPIEMKSLNKDQKQECASLIYRLHQAGFVHHSVAERNIVVQDGPLNQWPLSRQMNSSFRLIDFGRTTLYNPRDAAIDDCHITKLVYPEE